MEHVLPATDWFAVYVMDDDEIITAPFVAWFIKTDKDGISDLVGVDWEDGTDCASAMNFIGYCRGEFKSQEWEERAANWRKSHKSDLEHISGPLGRVMDKIKPEGTL